MCMIYNNRSFLINNILVNNIPLTNSARGWELFLFLSRFRSNDLLHFALLFRLYVFLVVGIVL